MVYIRKLFCVSSGIGRVFCIMSFFRKIGRGIQTSTIANKTDEIPQSMKSFCKLKIGSVSSSIGTMPGPKSLGQLDRNWNSLVGKSYYSRCTHCTVGFAFISILTQTNFKSLGSGENTSTISSCGKLPCSGKRES